ncbi:MAG TPA: ERF family protein [Actinomycetes bacterium]|nr:ERF family protein [Actinomycetes bacterium]
MPARKTAAKEPLESQICGVMTPDGMCNLKPHDETVEHKFIDPKAEAERIFKDDMASLDETAKRPVIIKLAQIMAELPTLEPAGENRHFGYKYITDKQVNGVIRPRMAALRLMVVPDVVEESWVETKTAKGGTSWVTKLKIRFTVIDGDSGDSITGVGFGYGDDTGDKGANKAFTAAMKYWLIKLFQIGGEDDLESDNRADLRAADREAGSAADRGVRVEGREITGVRRGGKSEAITRAQMAQIGSLIKDLELTPETFVDRFLNKYLPAKLVLPEDGDVQDVIKGALAKMSGDDAGALISDLVDAKDQPVGEADAVALATYDEDTDAH